jgi:hypothetical protein
VAHSSGGGETARYPSRHGSDPVARIVLPAEVSAEILDFIKS